MQFPITIFPAGSNATDPDAVTATATLAVRLNAVGAILGGSGQFSVSLTNPPAP